MYFTYNSVVYVSPNLPIYPYLHPLSPGNNKFGFYICDSTSALLISSFVPFFLDSTYKRYHIFVFLCLTYFTQYDKISRSIHVAANGILLFFFMAK